MEEVVPEPFSSEAAPEVLASLRRIAQAQGRPFQAVVEDALREYVDRRQQARPRPHVLASFAPSLEEFDSLYRGLSK